MQKHLANGSVEFSVFFRVSFSVTGLQIYLFSKRSVEHVCFVATSM